MATIPENEPASFRAGDSVTWTKSVEDYTAGSGYTLGYAFRNENYAIDFSGTTGADGSSFLVELAATQTSSYTAGEYDWVAHVTLSGARYTVDSGRIEILPDLAAATAYDARSKTRIIYDDLIDKYKTLANNSGLQVQSYSVAGRGTTYTRPQDMLAAIKYWGNKVRAEEEAEAIANGKANPRRVGIRLTRL